MTTAATTPQTQSWRPLLWGFAAFAVLPHLPGFELLAPIAESLLLLIPVIAACAIVGWKLGGRVALAVIWLALAVWVLLQPAGVAGSPYDQMARGWAVLLAASFGLVSLWSTSVPFFVRALATVALATGIGFLIALAAPGGISRVQHASGAEFTRRASSTIESLQRTMETPEWRDLMAKLPALDTWNSDSEAAMRAMPDRSASLLPSLLALESLAALALGWGIYQRLSTVKIGPMLSPLMDFRFNDQLVWGLAVGGTMSLLPAFAEAKNAGFNLLIFFGALYLIRGIGVLAWMSKGRYAVILILSLIPQVFIAVTLALGLGDTWLDLRRRPKPS
jgi:hypothetical protein